MPKIVISYRRADSAGMTGRIYDRLEKRYGKSALFIDFDDIPVGINFRKHIDGILNECDLVLAVIGPKWLGHNEAGLLRIKDADDPVRLEMETALKGNIPIVPVLVDGAVIPNATQLPDTLQSLPDFNAATVEALANAGVRAALADLAQEIFPREQQTPAALAQLQKAEIEKWWPIIKAANIKPE